jgi:antitoxin ParD1/3/4
MAETVSPSLNAEWLSFIDSQVGQEGYETPDDYMRAMLRREREVARVRALLFEGRDSGPGEVADEAYFERQRERIRSGGKRSSAA